MVECSGGCLLYIIRHAEAAGNAARTFQGRTDAMLTERGRLQAERLAERFQKIPLDAVYTSPLQRAFDTAAAVCRNHSGLAPEINPDLAEIDGGDIEGRSWAEFSALFPQASALWDGPLHQFAAPGGESMRQVYDRVSRALMRIAAANPDRAVAVVSHGCAIKNLLCFASGHGFERLVETPWPQHASVSCVEAGTDGFHVRFVDDTSHLEQALRAHIRFRGDEGQQQVQTQPE